MANRRALRDWFSETLEARLLSIVENPRVSDAEAARYVWRTMTWLMVGLYGLRIWLWAVLIGMAYATVVTAFVGSYGAATFGATVVIALWCCISGIRVRSIELNRQRRKLRTDAMRAGWTLPDRMHTVTDWMR